MIIRPVRHQDAEAIIDMGLRMHRESAYAFLPFDREKIRRLVSSYVHDAETNCGLVAEQNGILLGMLGGYVTEYYFCDEKVACDMLLYVDKEYRGNSAAVRLIRAFRLWAVERGARELCLGVSTNIDTERTGRFYERMGLNSVGGIYKQRLV